MSALAAGISSPGRSRGVTEARVVICTVDETELKVANRYSGQTGTSPAGSPVSYQAMSARAITEVQPMSALTSSTRLRSNASAIIPPQRPATIIGMRPMPPTSETARVDSVMP